MLLNRINYLNSISKSAARSFNTSTTLKNVGAINGNAEAKSRVAGSYHWTLERSLSLVTVPLIVAPFFVGSVPAIDFALGVVIPLHTHIGLDSVITDYLPKRKFKVLGTVSKVGLGLATSLTMYGLFKLNTNDVGITEYTKRLWTGRTSYEN